MKKFFVLLMIFAMVLTMAACGGNKEQEVSVDLNAVFAGCSQYLPAMYTPDEATMLNFLGIDVNDCVQYKVVLCAEGMRADEIWLIEAKDEAALEKLQRLAQTRIEAKLDETISYVPDQYVIVEKAALLTQGKYLALLISPDVDAMKAEFEAAFQ